MLIGYAELRERHGVKYSKAHLWRLIKEGSFPKPIKISGSPSARNHWDDEEVGDYVKALIAARDVAAEENPEE